MNEIYICTWWSSGFIVLVSDIENNKLIMPNAFGYLQFCSKCCNNLRYTFAKSNNHWPWILISFPEMINSLIQFLHILYLFLIYWYFYIHSFDLLIALYLYTIVLHVLEALFTLYENLKRRTINTIISAVCPGIEFHVHRWGNVLTNILWNMTMRVATHVTDNCQGEASLTLSFLLQ